MTVDPWHKYSNEAERATCYYDINDELNMLKLGLYGLYKNISALLINIGSTSRVCWAIVVG